jgi:cell division protein FtsI (penicillin-binding protein 3)
VKDKSQWVVAEQKGSSMLLTEKRDKSQTIPNCMGMGARDATYLLESMGLSVDYHGAGKVLRQSVPPGTRAAQQRVTLYLH